MVEVFVIHIESKNDGNKGFLSRNTRKDGDDGIHVEFLREIQEGNDKADICMAVAYFARGSALKTKDLIFNEIHTHNDHADVIIEVQAKQISLADSRRLNNSTWTYK